MSIAEKIIRAKADYDAVYEAGKRAGDTVIHLTDYVTPQMFGANGEDENDDTEALQAAMNANLNVYIPSGVYYVDGAFGGWGNIDTLGGIRLRSGQRVYMETNCEIRVKDNPNSFYHAFVVSGCNNVEIHGGKIVGDGKAHEGAHGYGIHIMNSDNVLIDNADICNMNADGIMLSAPNELEGYNTNITIRDCSIHNCRRQGISVVVGDNVLISNCKFYNITGAAPQSGIDIEPSATAGEDMYVHDVTIENCKFIDNVQSFCFSKCHNLTVNNCVFSGGWSKGDVELGIDAGTMLGRVASEGNCRNVKFSNCMLNTFVADSNCDISFYGCDIGTTQNVDNENTGLKTVIRHYDCRFSGERTGIEGRVRAVLSRSGGEMYFHNCEFMVKVVNNSYDLFVYGSGFCQFDGCKFGTVDGEKVFLFNSDNTSFRFNNCHFDVNCDGTYPQMFLNPIDTIMQNCYVKTNGFTFTYTSAAVSSNLLVSGNVFERSGTEDYILHIGDKVYKDVDSPVYSITLVNNTCTNSSNNFVRNWSADKVTVTEINNNKI